MKLLPFQLIYISLMFMTFNYDQMFSVASIFQTRRLKTINLILIIKYTIKLQFLWKLVSYAPNEKLTVITNVLIYIENLILLNVSCLKVV